MIDQILGYAALIIMAIIVIPLIISFGLHILADYYKRKEHKRYG